MKNFHRRFLAALTCLHLVGRVRSELNINFLIENQFVTTKKLKPHIVFLATSNFQEEVGCLEPFSAGLAVGGGMVLSALWSGREVSWIFVSMFISWKFCLCVCSLASLIFYPSLVSRISRQCHYIHRLFSVNSKSAARCLGLNPTSPSNHFDVLIHLLTSNHFAVFQTNKTQKNQSSLS